MRAYGISTRERSGHGWAWMHNAVVREYGEIIGSTGLAVYAVLCTYVNAETQECFPSQKSIGSQIGCCQRTVQIALKKLEGCGLIKRTRRMREEDGARTSDLITLLQPSCFTITDNLSDMAYSEYLSTEHWKDVRDRALKRAKNRCQLCNGADGLQVHHRTYENIGHEHQEDVIVLCRECHKRHHFSEKES